MSRIVDALPAVVEIDATIEGLRQRERDLVARTAKARAKHHAAYAKWEAEAVEAELDGRTAKAPPEPPPDGGRNLAMGRLRVDIEQAIRDRHRTIVEHADEIRATVDEEGAEILSEARPLVESLTELVTRLRGVAAAVDEIADARAAIDTRQTRERRPPTVDILGLLNALDAGLAVVLDGRDPRPARTLGVQPGGTLGQTVKVEPSRPPTPERSEPEGETVTVVRTNPGAEL